MAAAHGLPDIVLLLGKKAAALATLAFFNSWSALGESMAKGLVRGDKSQGPTCFKLATGEHAGLAPSGSLALNPKPYRP